MRDTLSKVHESGRLIIGIGPMSKNCVDTVYRYSHEKRRPIMLIASRRQIECAKLGGGYVNNWTTESFGKYCQKLQETHPQAQVFLCRDHGGPWQGTDERGMELDEAMARALASYYADIESGFDLLHIDPSLCDDGNMSLRSVIENTAQLLEKCHEYAQSRGRKVQFEIGTEENSGSITTVESFTRMVQSIDAITKSKGIEKPIFIVGQTQSLIREMRQVGEFNEANTRLLVEAAEKYGFMLKEHNADYLDAYQVHQRLRTGVHAINIAPEFGVIESKVFLNFCMKNKRPDLAEKFAGLALDSGKWRKWMLNPDYVNDYDKATISGHYVFSKPQFAQLREELDERALDGEICQAIYARLEFYAN